MSKQQQGTPSPRAEVERYQHAIDLVRFNFLDTLSYLQTTTFERSQLGIVLALAQERVAELSRCAEAAEQDEIAWRGGP